MNWVSCYFTKQTTERRRGITVQPVELRKAMTIEKDTFTEDQSIIGMLSRLADDNAVMADMSDDAGEQLDSGANDSDYADTGPTTQSNTSSRVFGGSPDAKLAVHTLAGIAVDIAIGYPNGVDAGMVDVSLLDKRSLNIFRSAEPYLTANRGSDFKGYTGSFHSQFKDSYIEKTLDKLKTLNKLEAAISAYTAKGCEAPQAMLDKYAESRLTPKELEDAKIMQKEATKQKQVEELQCSNIYFQDIMDLMHIVLTSAKGHIHNTDDCPEADAADAFIRKLRSNPVHLARSLALDSSNYLESSNPAGVPLKTRPKGIGL